MLGGDRKTPLRDLIDIDYFYSLYRKVFPYEYANSYLLPLSHGKHVACHRATFSRVMRGAISLPKI